MKYESLIKAINVKMDMDPADDNDYYRNYYPILINECLSEIANTVLPYQRELVVTYLGETDEPPSDEIDFKMPEIYQIYCVYYKVSSEFVYDDTEFKVGDWVRYTYSHEQYINGEMPEKWVRVAKNNYGFLVEIPDNLLSFSTENLSQYINIGGDAIADPNILYINSKTLGLPKLGHYEIWYNSEYPDVSSYEGDQNLSFIPSNVEKIIPSYVAAQLMMSEDMQRAMILKNEYETKLARLDDLKPQPSYELRNDNGWTV